MRIKKYTGRRDSGYATVGLACVEDSRLSGLAKALHLYIMSRPENWILRTSDLVKRFKECRKTIYAALNELETAGYLVREQTRKIKPGAGVRFGEAIYHLYEEPAEQSSPCSQIAQTGNAHTRSAHAVKETHNNKQCTSYQVNNYHATTRSNKTSLRSTGKRVSKQNDKRNRIDREQYRQAVLRSNIN